MSRTNNLINPPDNASWRTNKPMRKFRKKPVVIEAHQFITVEDASKIIGWMVKNGHTCRYYDAGDTTAHYLVIPTLEGNMKAPVGSWIIRGISGEFYPCEPYIFEQTYEAEER